MSEVRLIDAIQLHRKIMDDAGYDFSKELNLAQCLLYVENAPTIEAKPIQHGLWLNMTKGIPPANQLIPCSEQMMPDGAKVLVLLSNGEYFVMTRHGNAMSDGLRHLNDLQSVTHWMPLPEKPEDLNHG